ncbi:MAG: succinate dehydrogenase, hydrophobic membrane anchor protein [Gammaproteobacteria bacterium]|nr:succinate dehydrogenase, hydrophobic membrane anchor protein [Gammaproteobacteria bacterium]
MSSLRELLSVLPGFGREAVAHWWMQRLTAAALLPLSVWFVFSIAMLGDASHEAVVSWLKTPSATVLMGVFIVMTFYHTKLGIQVIIEDYVGGWLQAASMVLLNVVCILFAVAGILALLKIAL